jgi:hypothetical protein
MLLQAITRYWAIEADGLVYTAVGAFNTWAQRNGITDEWFRDASLTTVYCLLPSVELRWHYLPSELNTGDGSNLPSF